MSTSGVRTGGPAALRHTCPGLTGTSHCLLTWHSGWPNSLLTGQVGKKALSWGRGLFQESLGIGRRTPDDPKCIPLRLGVPLRLRRHSCIGSGSPAGLGLYEGGSWFPSRAPVSSCIRWPPFLVSGAGARFSFLLHIPSQVVPNPHASPR